MNKQLGMNIRAYRKTHGIKQESLAEAVGCSCGHIAHIESGKTNPSLKIARKIAEVLGIPLDFLLKGNYREHPDAYGELIKKLDVFPEEEQKEICALFLQILDFLHTYREWR